MGSLLAGITDEEAAKFAGIAESWEGCIASIGRWFGIGPMTDVLPDPDYGAAGQFSKRFRSDLNILHSPILVSPTVSFIRNMERVSAMHTLPLALIYWVARSTKNSCAAAAEAGVNVLDALSPEAHSNLAMIKARLRIEQNEFEGDQADGVPLDQKAAAFGANHLARLLQTQPPPRDVYTRGGVESILFSMVTSSYAAFETLAQDVWIAIVNEYPKPLAVNWCKAHLKNKLTLAELADHGFDLSRQMGAYLVDEAGATFQRMEEIKNQYRSAFGVEALSCFDPDEGIYLASKVRNVIAHRGGIVDARFVYEVSRHSEYARQKVGEHLHLSGSMVRELVDACVDCAIRLGKFADEWIKRNGAKTPAPA